MADATAAAAARAVASALGRINVAPGASINMNVHPGNVTINNPAASTPVHIWGSVHNSHFGQGQEPTAVINTSTGQVRIPRPEDITAANGTQTTPQSNGTSTATSGGGSTRKKSKSKGDVADSCTRSRPTNTQRRARQFTVSKTRRRVVYIGRERDCQDCSTKFSPMQWATGAKEVSENHLVSTPTVVSLDKKAAFAALSAAFKQNKEQARGGERTDMPTAVMGDDQSAELPQLQKIVKFKFVDAMKANEELEKGKPNPSKATFQVAPYLEDGSKSRKRATAVEREFENQVEDLSRTLDTEKKRRRLTLYRAFPDLHSDILEMKNKARGGARNGSFTLPTYEDEGYEDD